MPFSPGRRPTIQYPPDGKLMGDWKKGEKLAQSGYGGRFTDYPPRAENGGNCYACHQLEKKELSFGTLGPSLLQYGKDRKFREAEIKAVYERIYNPQATIPCANMPRMGSEQISDNRTDHGSGGLRNVAGKSGEQVRPVLGCRLLRASTRLPRQDDAG